MAKTNIIALALATTAVTAANTEAHAERYMVKLRSPSTFKSEVDTLRKNLVSGNWGRHATSSKLFGKQVRFVDAISRGNLLIVDSNDKAAIEGLKFDPSVEYVEQEQWFKIPNIRLSQKSLSYSQTPSTEEITWGLEAVGAQTAWNLATEGSKGLGVRVAVIDSGIDRAHVDLKDRFEKGEDFLSRPPSDTIGDAIFSKLFTNPIDDVLVQEPSEALPYPYFDQIGHGTHVAGTIAASENGQGVVGVAPAANVLAARVCGGLGCSSVGIVRAIDWAISEKVDVINMSLGGPFPSKAQLEATERAEAAGVTVVAASGNDGSDRIGYPAGFPTVISVGAVTPELSRAPFSQHGEGLSITAPGTEVNSSVPAGTGRSGQVYVSIGGADQAVPSTSFLGATPTNGILGAELVHVRMGTPEDFTLVSDKIRGKIALIQRGSISFVEKVENAIAAGAAAAVIYNNTPGLMSGALTDGGDIGIPVLMIEQGLGEELAAKLVVGETLTARVRVDATDFAEFQGTSMASPHVAGIVALLKAANKALTPDQIRSILKFTATKDAHMTEYEYGAGVANAAKAVEFVESTKRYNWDRKKSPGSERSLPEVPVLAATTL